MTETAKVLVADGHEIVREGLANKLAVDCGYNVVGHAADRYSTIKACRLLLPDILVMGLSLTRPSGIETFSKIRRINAEIKIVIMSQDANPTDAFTAMSEGALGFIPRDARVVDLVNAVKSAELGYACLPCEYIQQFTNLRRNVTRTGNIYGLSPRELEVVEACATGAKTKEVADMLAISVRTVETHRNSIYRKTDCRSISELSEIAEQL